MATKPDYDKHLYHPRGAKEYAGLVARGFAMGSADVVPGVSGGTMAFILGIYEELINSIRTIARPEFLRPLSKGRLLEAFRAINGGFLLAVGSGIILAILTLAKAIEWALENHPIWVWSFFFGLVLASVVTVARRVGKWNPLLFLYSIAGAVGAWVFVGLVPVQTPETWWFLFLAGAIAICAMILPGISGAFLLLLLGKYDYVLGAVNDRNIEPIFWVVLGALVGIVSFAQVLGWLFRRFHDPTVAALTGLMVGSLRKVWPWKEDLAWVLGRHGERVPTVQRNVLPDAGGEVVVALLVGLAGLVLVIVLEWWASQPGEKELRAGS
jgi:putative membrane protein